MIGDVLAGVKDYGPAVAAFVIAASSIYTAWVLRRQNRSTGWLEVVGWRVIRLNGIPELYRGDPIPETDQRRQEIQIQIVNTGYRLEQIMEIRYYVRQQGWLFAPQHADTIYLWDPNPEPIETAPAPHRVFLTPFKVEPQELRRWEHGVGHRIVGRGGGETIRDDQRLHLITCAKVTTAKGETMHVRLMDARDLSSRARRYCRNVCCRIGVHR